MKQFELNEMELDMVSGGRPRIRLHGPRRKPFQLIRDIIDVVKDIVTPPKKDTPAPDTNAA
ncbi:hypothetical protein D081_2054 [Anaerovibrio sp. JC8]|uniref:hypothetical protein n=1 Tax=Anaerovibrio sp. JC8 TaxID=1240085 RepID=UPI000A0A8EFD|nr:hypothetical protein [Anaerovibrio sp. JC8]ORT99325.1 hypothetical protein D081_2054 [Anaerovibrio sp. JC8]